MAYFPAFCYPNDPIVVPNNLRKTSLSPHSCLHFPQDPSHCPLSKTASVMSDGLHITTLMAKGTKVDYPSMTIKSKEIVAICTLFLYYTTCIWLRLGYQYSVVNLYWSHGQYILPNCKCKLCMHVMKEGATCAWGPIFLFRFQLMGVTLIVSSK